MRRMVFVGGLVVLAGCASALSSRDRAILALAALLENQREHAARITHTLAAVVLEALWAL